MQRPVTDPQRTCDEMQLYQDITGNSRQGMGGRNSADDVSISPSFRTAMFHFIFTNLETRAARTESFYALGENSYMNEAAYEFEGDSWKQRLWGSNYGKLLAIKQKYDPDGVFLCRHCIGDDA